MLLLHNTPYFCTPASMGKIPAELTDAWRGEQGRNLPCLISPKITRDILPHFFDG